jgi:hypothetical protein
MVHVDFYRQSPGSVTRTSESEVGRGGSRSDGGRGKKTGRGGKREPRPVEPKKYEEPDVKVGRRLSPIESYLNLA